MLLFLGWWSWVIVLGCFAMAEWGVVFGCASGDVWRVSLFYDKN